MVYELHIKGFYHPIEYEDIAMVDTGVWAYSNKKSVFYPYSVVECIIEGEDQITLQRKQKSQVGSSMKEEHIRYGKARMLPTENVAPFVNRIYDDIRNLIKKRMEAKETTYEEQCALQDLLDYMEGKDEITEATRLK